MERERIEVSVFTSEFLIYRNSLQFLCIRNNHFLGIFSTNQTYQDNHQQHNNKSLNHHNFTFHILAFDIDFTVTNRQSCGHRTELTNELSQYTPYTSYLLRGFLRQPFKRGYKSSPFSDRSRNQAM